MLSLSVYLCIDLIYLLSKFDRFSSALGTVGKASGIGAIISGGFALIEAKSEGLDAFNTTGHVTT